MIRPIVTDDERLSIKSEKATQEDAEAIQDLLDTFEAHADECVSMAANMIGINKRIIVVSDSMGTVALMVNPQIIDRKQPCIAKEGCICRPDADDRPAKRYKRIKVRYLDADFDEHTVTLHDFDAQVVQHGIDHCNGVLI